MSNSSKQQNQSAAAAKTGWLKILIALVVVGAIVAIVVSLLKNQEPVPIQAAATNPPPAATSTESQTNTAAEPAKVDSDFLKLKGRWVRPDGGYVIEVTHIDADGKAKAGYFNPNPIRVSRAEVKKVDGKAAIFIELRGQGYPGSTYTLTYHEQRDELEGVYFQAAMGSYYDVLFQRMK